ncbi:MAG: carboxypeptidase-like regulatory domain-containing protein [Candidatus Baltobacteraceae bacterium]
MKAAALILFIAFANIGLCFAGTTGVLSGYVCDATGRPVAKAHVVAIAPTGTCKRYTDGRGFFVCLSLPPDWYLVTAQRAHALAYAIDVRIDSDRTTSLTFHFYRLARCPAFTRPRRDAAPLSSLDVRRMDRYPPNLAPLIFLPMAPIARRLECL